MVDISQVRAFSRDLRAAALAAKPRAQLAVQKVCAATARDAQILAPVDTGFLRNSISYEVSVTGDGATGEVGPTANYGLFVELGTSRAPGQPFLAPAFDRNEATLDAALDTLLTGPGR